MLCHERGDVVWITYEVAISRTVVVMALFMIRPSANRAARATPTIWGLRRHGDLHPIELLANLGHHTHVLADASGDHKLLPHSHCFQEGHHPCENRPVQPGEDVGLVRLMPRQSRSG